MLMRLRIRTLTAARVEPAASVRKSAANEPSVKRMNNVRSKRRG
jgi:hypothetical protein